MGIYITSTGRRNVAERACPRLSALWRGRLRVAFRMRAWTLVAARGARGAHETDTRAAVGDGKRDVILLRLQVDVLDEQRKQLSLRTPVPAVWLQLATFAPAVRGSPHPYTPVTRTFGWRRRVRTLEPPDCQSVNVPSSWWCPVCVSPGTSIFRRSQIRLVMSSPAKRSQYGYQLGYIF